MAIAASTSLSPTQPGLLNPFITYNPIQQQKVNTLWSTIWKVASLLTAFCFTAVSIIATSLTIVYWPAHLPIVSLTVFAGGLPASFQVFKYMWDKSDAYAQETKIDAKLIAFSDERAQKMLPNRLHDLGISPSIETSKLHFAFARYLYFQELMKKNLESAKAFAPSQKNVSLVIDHKQIEISPQKYTLNQIDFTKKKEVKIFEALQKKRAERENFLQEAALCNLKSAYLLKILEKPDELRSISDFFYFKNVSYPMRLVSRDYKDPKSDVLIQTPKKNYTIGELLKKTPQVLSREIFSPFSLFSNWL